MVAPGTGLPFRVRVAVRVTFWYSWTVVGDAVRVRVYCWTFTVTVLLYIQ